MVFNRHAAERALVNKLTTHHTALQTAASTEIDEATDALVPLPGEVELENVSEPEASPQPVGVRVVDALAALHSRTR